MKVNSIKSGKYKLVALGIFALITACDQKKNHQPLVPLPIEAEVEDTASDIRVVSFQEIQPILAQNCMGCHDFASNQTSFNEAVRSGEVIRRIWEEKDNPLISMPQGPSAKTIQLDEREAIFQYALGVLKPSEQKDQMVSAPSSITAPEALPISETQQYKILSSCTNCHGVTGISQMSGVPNLAGLTYEYILKQILSFKKIKIDESENFIVLDSSLENPPRQDANSNFGHIMNRIVHDLNYGQIQFIAAYFSLSRREASNDITISAAAPAEFSMCISCHDGSRDSIGPLIHGQNAEYIANQLRAYKSGTRSDSMMNGIAATLELDNIDELAKYISQLKTQ